jgi:8-oxo-dGTP diphosphatase
MHAMEIVGSLRDEIVTAILKDDDRILLCHRSARKRWYPSVWDLPGGHVEPGETPAQALVRELREELNVRIDEPASEPRAVIDTAHAHMLIWAIEAWDGTVSNAAPDEHDDITWVDRTGISALEFAHGSYRALFDDVLTSLR